jgi:hypothetical protein
METLTRRDEMINRIVDSARVPMPTIREIFHLRGTDGKLHSGWGMPRGVDSTGERVSMGYCFVNADGCTYGTRYASIAAAAAAWEGFQAKRADDFRSELVKMSPARLASQAKFWLGKVA